MLYVYLVRRAYIYTAYRGKVHQVHHSLHKFLSFTALTVVGLPRFGVHHRPTEVHQVHRQTQSRSLPPPAGASPPAAGTCACPPGAVFGPSCGPGGLGRPEGLPDGRARPGASWGPGTASAPPPAELEISK